MTNTGDEGSMAASSADGSGEETLGGETPSELRSSTADMRTPRTYLACTDSKSQRRPGSTLSYRSQVKNTSVEGTRTFHAAESCRTDDGVYIWVLFILVEVVDLETTWMRHGSLGRVND